MSETKRPFPELPTPETLAALFGAEPPRKRQLIPRTEVPSNPNAVHAVPHNIYPIVQAPYSSSDFFSDLTVQEDDKRVVEQREGILRRFPPPIAPLMSLQQQEEGGIMIPFIFPPPPIVSEEKDVVLGRLKETLAEKQREADAENAPVAHERRHTRSRTSRAASLLTTVAQEEPEEPPAKSPLLDNGVYVQLPPLPFPPANYMPYPLRADDAGFTPAELFGDLIRALEALPRIDMVVASAAGSLHDMRAQAGQEGFTIKNHERLKAAKELLQELEEQYRDSRDNSSDSGSDNDEYLSYVAGIDVSNLFDYYDRMKQNSGRVYVEVSRLPAAYVRVKPRESALKHSVENYEHEEDTETDLESDDVDAIMEKALELEEETSQEWTSSHSLLDFQPLRALELLLQPAKDVTNANRNNKERRRVDLCKSVEELELFERKHRYEVYQSTKLELLERLSNLKASKVFFEDEKCDIRDDDLLQAQITLQTKRDDELLRLKMHQNYELLRALADFYRDLNKVYRSFGALMKNKLQKLRNFFEFQQESFSGFSENSQDDVFDISHRDSARLYAGVSNTDFVAEIKEQFLRSSSELNSVQGVKAEKEPETPPSSGDTQVVIHDFMPLITSEEFGLITGNLPSKLKGPKEHGTKVSANLKHKIFQSLLYDQTLGSDSNEANMSFGGANGNGSDSNLASLPIKRRPGRRAAAAPPVSSMPLAKSLYEKPGKEHSEANLLARIMKQFVGPLLANAEELTGDFEMMGVETRWPVTR